MPLGENASGGKCHWGNATGGMPMGECQRGKMPQGKVPGATNNSPREAELYFECINRLPQRVKLTLRQSGHGILFLLEAAVTAKQLEHSLPYKSLEISSSKVHSYGRGMLDYHWASRSRDFRDN